MLFLIKLFLIASLLGIFYQDIKERKVYLWLLILSVLLLGFLHYFNSLVYPFMISSLLNSLIIGLVLLILFVYAKLKLKQSLLKVFGLGDLLFFVAIAVGFPTLTFVVLFSFSLIFSLVLFLFIRKGLSVKSVPLAGLQALFFSGVFLLNWAFNFINLYQY